jgi:hypothetical protein
VNRYMIEKGFLSPLVISENITTNSDQRNFNAFHVMV